nr:MAG TPA: hypothetical protein [Caudoviricetes sp.]
MTESCNNSQDKAFPLYVNKRLPTALNIVLFFPKNAKI